AGGLAALTVRARTSEHQAQRASTERLALQLRSSAGEMGDDRLPLRALLVRAADRMDDTEVRRAEMLATVERARPIRKRVHPARGVGFDAMWADVGARTMAAGTGDGKITVWSLRGTVPDRASARTFDIGRTPLAMASQAGTGLLAVGGGDGSAEA